MVDSVDARQIAKDVPIVADVQTSKGCAREMLYRLFAPV
jgi:hypothetical protein